MINNDTNYANGYNACVEEIERGDLEIGYIYHIHKYMNNSGEWVETESTTLPSDISTYQPEDSCWCSLSTCTYTSSVITTSKKYCSGCNDTTTHKRVRTIHQNCGTPTSSKDCCPSSCHSQPELGTYTHQTQWMICGLDVGDIESAYLIRG